MPTQWYVLSSKPSKEDSLYQHATSNGFVVFYPTLYVKSTNPTARKFRPYFPGYMFIQVDLLEMGISKIRWMPYTNGLVSFDGEPPSVPDALISAIRRRVEELSAAAAGTLIQRFQSGEKVTIQDGPFSGYEAIFDAKLDGKDRVRVLLHLLGGRTIPVELRSGLIKRSNRTELEAR